MSADELRHEIADGVSFSGAEKGGSLVGVMGVQPVDNVILIRHAYVRTNLQHRGIGSELLAHLIDYAPRPVLIGTWKAARWAVRFYEKHDFCLVDDGEKNRLLRHYWDIPDRQVETSVVMADPRALQEIVNTPPPSRESRDDGIGIFKL
ncbi:MAG: GNAT family N-acetyltransferase [Rhodospirillaceae bacterium]|nr:GNAT family N-acetyltransferase [Rhodospirillaceae bacterium]